MVLERAWKHAAPMHARAIAGAVLLLALLGIRAAWPRGSVDVTGPPCDGPGERRDPERGPPVLVCGGGALSGRMELLLGRPLDVNRAVPDDLQAIPGIGEVLADRIVRDRQLRGPFADMAAVSRVHGIGAIRARQLGGWAVAGGANPR